MRRPCVTYVSFAAVNNGADGYGWAGSVGSTRRLRGEFEMCRVGHDAEFRVAENQSVRDASGRL